MSSSLSPSQQRLVDELVARLRPLPGVEAIALGGSHARGRARADSDIDLGLYYSDASPLSAAAVRDVAVRFPGSVDPVVSEPYEWGPWVNGGAWLTIEGQRVDLLYRSLEHLERAIDQAERGEHELHFGQQPPFGFFSATYMGELSIAHALHDPAGRVAALQRRVAVYPEALRRSVVQDHLWSVEFALQAFARKLASRGEVLLTAGTLARCAYGLILVLFALNRCYLVNDKTALDEVESFADAPDGFRSRVESLLASPGSDAEQLARSVDGMQALFEETAARVGDLYTAKYARTSEPA